MKPNQNERLEDDPLAGTGDDHPAGTGAGAAGGALAGAALGASAGPLGVVTGALTGAMIGAVLGKGIAHSIDPTSEEQYWQEHFHEQPYYQSNYTYDDFKPAYRLGWHLYTPGGSFEDIENELNDHWKREKGSSKLPLELARDAARASWMRMAKLSPRRN